MVHRINEEKTRQEFEDMINSIHEPSLSVDDFALTLSDSPPPAAARQGSTRWVTGVCCIYSTFYVYTVKICVMLLCGCSRCPRYIADNSIIRKVVYLLLSTLRNANKYIGLKDHRIIAVVAIFTSIAVPFITNDVMNYD